MGAVPTCLEWDSSIPDWSVMLEQVELIRTLHQPEKLAAFNPLLMTRPSQSEIEPPQALLRFQDDFFDAGVALED